MSVGGRAGLLTILAVGGALVMVLGYIPTREAPRAGQVVFLPTGQSEPGSPRGKSPPAGYATLTQCLADEAGSLWVSGHLVAPRGSVTVLVSDADPQGVGVRVGRQDVRDQQLLSEGLPDSAFRVSLGWADTSSWFASGGPFPDSEVDPELGPTTHCP